MVGYHQWVVAILFYIVTKSNFEATKDVIVNGWISSLGGSYFLPGYRG